MPGNATTSGGTQKPEQLAHCSAEAPTLLRVPSTVASSTDTHLGQWGSIASILAQALPRTLALDYTLK